MFAAYFNFNALLYSLVLFLTSSGLLLTSSGLLLKSSERLLYIMYMILPLSSHSSAVMCTEIVAVSGYCEVFECWRIL